MSLNTCLYPYCNETQHVGYKGKIYLLCKKHCYVNNEITYIIKYGEIEGKKKWDELVKLRNFNKSKEGLIQKYGKIEGKKRWNNTIKKRKFSISKEGLTLKHGIEKAEKICKSFSFNKNDYIEKYGLKKWNDKLLKIITRREYFLEDAQCNYDLADFLLSKRQSTFSKKKCIKKYGKRKGLKVWKERQEKWQHTLNSKPQEEKDRINKSKANTLNNFINRHGVHLGKIKYKKYIENKYDISNTSSAVSSAGNMFLQIIEDNLSINIKREVKIGKYRVDGVYKKIIFEFNGDYWHCNPKIYFKNYYNKSINMLSKEKWELDKERIIFLEKEGYNVIVVWEDDWNKNKDEIIKKCSLKLKKL